MKPTILSTIVVLAGIAQLSAQEKYVTDYEVQYDVKYSIDSTHLDKKTNEAVYLYTGSDYGVFMNFNIANMDSIQADIQRQLRATPRSYNDQISRKTNFNKTFFKDFQKNEVFTVYGLAGESYIFTEPDIPFDWRIKDSIKKSMGHALQKATTSFAGRDYVAWFTTEIPIHDGPYLFFGLPGLIVELYDTDNDYHFKLKSIRKLKKPKVWSLPEGKPTTKGKLKKLLKKLPEIKARNKFTPRGGETEVNVIVNGKNITQSEYRKLLEKRMARKNNPIELK